MNDNHPKITTTHPISVDETSRLKNKVGKQGNPDFNNILSEQIQSKGMDSTSHASTALPEIQGAFKAQNIELNTVAPNPFAEKITDSLDLLERYAAFLANPDKSLKQAYSILEQVLAQTKDIETLMGQGSENKGDLTTILTELMTTARVEQIKLDRGDYL